MMSGPERGSVWRWWLVRVSERTCVDEPSHTENESEHVGNGPRCIVEDVELAGLQQKVPECR